MVIMRIMANKRHLMATPCGARPSRTAACGPWSRPGSSWRSSRSRRPSRASSPHVEGLIEVLSRGSLQGISLAFLQRRLRSQRLLKGCRLPVGKSELLSGCSWLDSLAFKAPGAGFKPPRRRNRKEITQAKSVRQAASPSRRYRNLPRPAGGS